LLALVLAGCTGRRDATDLDGHPVAPLQVPAGAVHVVVFTSQECPIANSYAPTLRELAARWHGKPVQLFLVHVDPECSAAAARRHAVDYELPGTVLLDPAQVLAASVGATRTPEAAVCTAAGTVYRGRIDDQWRALGSRAPAATTHELADAVAAALAGARVAQPWPAAVGCLLPEPAAR
jgi:hypothetical protein